jgi:hypothetical protein
MPTRTYDRITELQAAIRGDRPSRRELRDALAGLIALSHQPALRDAAAPAIRDAEDRLMAAARD